MAIEKYLNEVVAPSIRILPYDAQASEWHAAERPRLSAAGRTPPFADGQIAATASVYDLIPVTANLADHADFRDVRVVDWPA